MKKPIVIEWEDAADPAAAPPVPDAVALQTVMRVGAKRPSRLWKFALWAFGAAASFILSVAAYDFVTGLLSRSTVLGTIAFALIGLATLAAFMLAGREALAYLRLGRLDDLRLRAENARLSADVKEARAAVQGIEALYAHRPEMKGNVAALRARQAEVFDADALLAMTEMELLAPLDQAARREVESASRQVAMVTALVPVALADVATALFANLRMVRRIAEIYGGRAGNVGSLKLMQRVFGYLVATGALAVGDDLIGSVAGGGLLSRVSRRFGEGVINGALTARIGVAAMELSRPMAFHSAPKPKIPNLLSRALTGLWEKADQTSN